MSIENHELFDEQILLNTVKPIKGQDLSFYFHDAFYSDTDERDCGDEVNFELSKEDVIALAKHFELTESDLNKQGK